VSQEKVIVVMPAYNAAKTLRETYESIPRDIVDKVILVDDVSQDETVAIARSKVSPPFQLVVMNG